MDGKWDETAHDFDCGLLFSSAACKCLTFVVTIGACAAKKRQHVVLELGVKTLHSSWKHGPEDSQTIPQMHVQRIIIWYSFSCPNIQWNAAPHTFRATKLLRSSFSRRLYLSKRRFKSDMPASVWYLFKSSKRPDSSKFKVWKKKQFKSRNMPKSLVRKENSEKKTQNLETCYGYKDNLRQLQDLLDLSSGLPFTFPSDVPHRVSQILGRNELRHPWFRSPAQGGRWKSYVAIPIEP